MEGSTASPAPLDVGRQRKTSFIRVGAYVPSVEVAVDMPSDDGETIADTPLSPSTAIPRQPLQGKQQQLCSIFKAAMVHLKDDPKIDLARTLHTLVAKVKGGDNAPGQTHQGRPGNVHMAGALPFVSHMCLTHALRPEEPWDINCAVLVLDICAYSRVTAALAVLGPHSINRAVNTLLEPVITKILASGGDVLKFAGDAILAVWFAGDMQHNTQETAACVLWLQENCGEWAIPGTDEVFRFHMGIACGTLTSHILFSRFANFEDLRFVTGSPLEDSFRAAKIAVAKQVGITAECVRVCPGMQVAACESPRFYLLQGMGDGPASPHLVVQEKPVHLVSRFISPHILRWLNSGKPPAKMEANRMMTVLFIGFHGSHSVEEWVCSVQHILVKYSCNPVQVMDDDKGVHIIAASNIFITEPTSPDASVPLVQALVSCHTGVAHGMGFCGLTGSHSACR